MLSLLRRIFQKHTTPLNTIVIDPWKFGANIELLTALHPHDALFPVIKSNAYGHGIKQIIKLLNDVNCTYICVDSYPEYAQARSISQHQFLVLSDTHHENYRLFDRKRTAFVVSSHAALAYFVHRRKPVRIHLFLNTGMHREGFDEADLPDVIAQLRDARHITVEGVMSHLSHGDAIDTMITDGQIARFKALYTIITHAGHTPRYRHIGASAGIFTIKDPFFTAWRPGKSMYGYTPFTANHPQSDAVSRLQPIATVTSTILNIRTIAAGQSVGYSGTWTADRESRIALIPRGYFEGLPRSLSNRRSVRRLPHETNRLGIGGANGLGSAESRAQMISLVGNISMNYCCADVTDIAGAAIGDTIELFSPDVDEAHSVAHAADVAETIDYEIMVHWDRGVKREIMQ